MAGPGIRLALWLLTFAMSLSILSSSLLYPAGVRSQLCESGHLGGKQNWKHGLEENGEGEGNPENQDGMADDQLQPLLFYQTPWVGASDYIEFPV